MLSSVDFPAPEGPIIVTNSPGWISRLILRNKKNLFGPASTTFSRFRSCIKGSTSAPCGSNGESHPYLSARSGDSNPVSLVPQGGDWIHAHSAPRGKVGRQCGNGR